MSKGIILNADDYGAMNFIDQGIEAGIAAGVVNSVSVFVTFGVNSHHNIKALYEKYKDRIKIGLHFTITAGRPLGTYQQVPSLYKGFGRKKRKFRLFQHLDVTKIPGNEFAMELELQLAKLAELLDGYDKIDHINSHQGILNFIPSFWEVLLDLAKKEPYSNLPFRSPVTYEMEHRFKTDPRAFLPITRLALGNILGLLKNPYTAALFMKGTDKGNLRVKQTRAEREGHRLPNYYITSYFGQPSDSIIEKLVNDIADGEVAEFMLHLGKGSYEAEYNRKKHWGIREKSLTKRAKELQVLTEAVDFPKLLQDKGVTATNYSKITTRS